PPSDPQAPNDPQAPADPNAPPDPGATTPAAAEVMSSAPVWAVPGGGGGTTVAATGRFYRGVLQAAAGGAGLHLVNQVDVDTYLRGLGEMPASWPAAAQQAQAVAARTWALRAMRSGGELCDTQRCQVYLGAGVEEGGRSAAVDATAGLVLTYGGQLASTVYSADAGGVTATPSEGFGTSDGAYPYLTTVRYATPDPRPWQVDVALSDVADRVGYPGTVTGVRVASAGPSGRALQVELDGDAGPRLVEGRAFAATLGLRSTLFTPVVGAAATAPQPPAPLDPATLQAFPDAVATPRLTKAKVVPWDVGDGGDGIDGHPAVLVAIALLGAATYLAVNPAVLARSSPRGRPRRRPRRSLLRRLTPRA
ncbi:MAG: SpoIID/LytB domain-containing protein, partial [Acidimicrobiales bacterium]